MYKVVYNVCFGGFGLSDEAEEWLNRRTNDAVHACWEGIPRHHPLLVECVETLCERAGADYSDLQICEVNGPYRISEYDGFEAVLETDNEWIDPSEF